MIYKGTILAILVILTNSGYCQLISPRVISYEGQVGLFIVPAQAKTINLTYAAYDECKEHRDSLTKKVDSATVAIALCNSRLRGKDTIISLKIAESHLKDSLNTLQKASIANKDKKIEKVTKGRNTWKVIGLSGWGVIIVAGLVLLL